ncbi:hypothetical protein A4G99_00645 [Haladaptatus sp. R4]|uniref:hypothetical protein n=1 Tax=Haladaptatus sp. R4 TaxID=1679489 RepID=UPI0007B4B55D|nr:hypothetical protein [Haladaptatus sp. R4]KZN25080.1 hypothetical protein A4G99_00645 [Haladaptatus sp. R4]
MTNDDPDLERRLEDGMEEIRSTLDATDGDELSDEAGESVRERADAVAEAVSDASLGELLTASGFENDSEDVTPADLPMLMQDADADAVLSLRHLLEMADLSDEWSNLDAEGRLERLERIGEDETEDDGNRSVSDLLSSVFSLGSSDETENADGTADDGEESDESEFLSTEDAVEEFSSLFGRLKGDEEAEDDADEVDDDEDGAEDEEDDGGPGRGGATDMYSTMPSSRSDMGSRKRHSTVRKKS